MYSENISHLVLICIETTFFYLTFCNLHYLQQRTFTYTIHLITNQLLTRYLHHLKYNTITDSTYNTIETLLFKQLNPLLPKSDLQILLCLTPDDFTHQRETSWALKVKKLSLLKGLFALGLVHDILTFDISAKEGLQYQRLLQ